MAPFTVSNVKHAALVSLWNASLTDDNKTPRKGQAVTFGLELEFNIAFTEQAPVDTLDKHKIKYTHIQKEHLDSAHSSLLAAEDYSKTCRSRYPSWGIAMPLDAEDPYTNPLLTNATYNTAGKQSGQPLRVRSYISEPLLLAQQLMEANMLHADVRAIIRNLCATQPEIPLPGSESRSDYLLTSSADYSKWTLTNDHTLIGSLKSQLLSHLPSKITASNADNWDSYGIELVSPIFSLSNKADATEEISSYLSSLSSSPSTEIIPSTWAGLHIHIGFAATKPEDLNLKTLQCLAYILLVHENLISSLFSSHCSGFEPTVSEPEEPEDPYAGMSDEEFEEAWARDQALMDAPETSSDDSPVNSSFTDSSTCSFTTFDPDSQPPQTEQQKDADNEQQVLLAEKNFTNHQNKLSNARYLASLLGAPHPAPPSAIAKAIFSATDITSLVHLLQRPKNEHRPDGDMYRGYMYNFSNILTFYQTGKGKPTVEFRQHECCIDAQVVERWVNFTEAIVKKAENLAANEDRNTHEEDFPKHNVEELCNWLSLAHEDKAYWTDRQRTLSKEMATVDY